MVSPFSVFEGLGTGKVLTRGEIEQLEKINNAQIDEETWDHVAEMDQDVSTTSDVQFPKIILPDGTEVS